MGWFQPPQLDPKLDPKSCTSPLSSRPTCKGLHITHDPTIAAELWAYVCSNKWAMNPEKLRQFSKIELLTNAATKYLHHLVCEEMPVGLKKYMEVGLFPCIHLWVGHFISFFIEHSTPLAMAGRLLLYLSQEGPVFWWSWLPWCLVILSKWVSSHHEMSWAMSGSLCC